MKQLTRLLGIILLIPLHLNVLRAQEKDLDVEIKEEMDQVFEHIDKSKIETGLLSDYGCWLIDPYVYNGILTNDNYVSMENLKIAYLCMYTCQINGNVCLKEPAQLFSGLIKDAPALLFMQYNRLDDGAFNDGRLTIVNEQLRETGRSGSSIYLKQDLFAVGLPKKEFEPRVSFTFRKGNYISNFQELPAHLSIRFHTGSVFQNITWEQPVTYTFASYGEKEITIRAKYSNGKILESHARIRITPPKPIILERESEADETIEIKGTNEHNGGRIQIKYAAFNTKKEKLIRPLIIADESQISEYFAKNEEEREDAKVDLDFLFKKGTKEIMQKVNQIYDVVYVDNNDGFDNIFRNAQLFEEAMIQINRKRDQIHDKSYVIGLGMGGLVARYALQNMEREGLDHGACKFISLNTPHKGANIPVGLQGLIRYVQNLRVAKIFVKDILGKVDSIGDLMNFKSMRQMMVYSIDNKYHYSNEHATFMKKYEEAGMPRQCENVAISNGNYGGFDIGNAGRLLFQKSDDWFGFKSDIYFLKQKQELLFFSGSIKAFRGKFRKKKLWSTSEMVAVDGAPGSAFSLSSIFSEDDAMKNAFKWDKFCFVPTVSALALDDWGDKLLSTNWINNSTTCFDRIYASRFENYEYADLAICKDFLLKELAPQIEGTRDKISSETTFTVTNVPFSLPVTWTLSNDNFKIVSKSGNKVTVVPLKFNSSSELKVSISFSGINIPIVSLPIISETIDIYGDTYISQLYNRYEIYDLPENTTLRWRVADGLKIKEQSGLYIIACAVGKTTPWIEATITTRYNTETVIRKDLKCMPLTGACLQYLDSWVGKNEKGEYIKKYAYRLVYEPAEIPLRQLEFCWSNTVMEPVRENGSDIIHTLTPKSATIQTEGNVASSYYACSMPNVTPSLPPVSMFNFGDVVSASSPLINPGLDPDNSVPYIWAHSINHATVWMPQIYIGEESKGRLYCTVKDYLGNRFSVMSPEQLWDKWQYEYHVAPNPVNTILTLSKQNQENGKANYSISEPESLTIDLYNDFGIIRSVESDTSKPETQMNVADLPNGTYYLNVTRNGEIIQRCVVLIRHN